MKQYELLLIFLCFVLVSRSLSDFWKSNSINPSTFIDGEVAQCVKEINSGGFLACGNTMVGTGTSNCDAVLLKLDPAGNLLWSKTYDGTNSDFGYALIVTSDGSILITGSTTSFGSGLHDVYTVKTDFSGNLVWSRTCTATSASCFMNDGTATIDPSGGELYMVVPVQRLQK